MEKNEGPSKIPRVGRTTGAPAVGVPATPSKLPKPSMLPKRNEIPKPSKLVRPLTRETTACSTTTASSSVKPKTTKVLSRPKICDQNETATRKKKLVLAPQTPANGTIVLLKRDNTFDITDNTPRGGNTTRVISEQVQETPGCHGDSQHVRPKRLQLDLTKFESPARFSLDNIPASTPNEAAGRSQMMPPMDNTFALEQTPKGNLTERIGGSFGDLTESQKPLIHINLTMNVTQTLPLVINPEPSLLPPPPPPPNKPYIMDSGSLRPRESFGLLSDSMIASLEEPLIPDYEPSCLIKFNESNGDRTLVAEASNASNSLHQPPTDPFGSIPNVSKAGYSKPTDNSLSCSFDLEDVTNPIKAAATPTETDTNSYGMEESLGILTPDQMKDFGDTTASRPSLDLCLIQGNSVGNLRVEQTPSPEELPLDPPLPSLLPILLCEEKKATMEVEKSEFSEMTESAVMKSSSHSKGSHLESSVITSMTSLDGYQGDGEMSRPASRNAEEKASVGGPLSSPIKRFQNFNNILPRKLPQEVFPRGEEAGILDEAPLLEEAPMGPVVRRPDPLTDSDFFTESDADDLHHHHRGDRRAQIIDGHLYGQNVVAVQAPGAAAAGESSGMESSGVFTDAEQNLPGELQFDMSPDERSTETVESSGNSQRAHRREVVEDLDATIRPEDNLLEVDVEEEPEAKQDKIASKIGDCDKMEVEFQPADNSGGATTREAGGERVVANQSHNNNKQAAMKRGNPAGRRSDSTSPPIVKKKMVEQQPATTNSAVKVQVNNKMASNVVVKKAPNKWDAVMNKIAQNQSVMPSKNYNEVKSRVNSAPKCRIEVTDMSVDQQQQTPGKAFKNSPSSKRQDNCVTNPSKRGRFTTTPNKDSRQSSNSDISLNGSATKAPLVQQQQHLIIPKKPQTITQKQRTNQQNQPPTLAHDANNNKNVHLTPVKPNGKRVRNGESPVSLAKFPLKENNRLANPQQPPVTVAANQPQQPLHPGRPIAPSTPQGGNSSPKVVRAKTNGPLSSNHHVAANRLRSKESSPELGQATVAVQSLEKRILDAVALLRQHQYAVLDGGQQEEAASKLAKFAGVEQELHVQSCGVKALGVLVNYLVTDYDAFSTPTLKRNCQIASEKLVTTQKHLEETCNAFRQLEDRLASQEDHLANVSEENVVLKEQLSRVSNDLETSQRKALVVEEENRCRTQELEARLGDLMTRENELRERAMESEMSYSGRIKDGEQREKELQERLQKMEKDFEMLRVQSEAKEKELKSQLEARLQEKEEEADVVLRCNQSMGELSHDMLPVTPRKNPSFRHSSPLKNSSSEMETESLRCVLDLKMTEAADLRRQNQELQRTADEYNLQQTKLRSLESKVEDLQFQLSGRIERENELLMEMNALKEKAAQESKHCHRLSIHNEELQWKLKQNSERYHTTLQELSRSYHDRSSYLRSEDDLAAGANGSLSGEESTVSPPASPRVKGIVETSDAVSYILEIDDESPVQVASKAIRRMGSFRSSPVNVLKRSKSSSQSPMASPLSQSASATAIMRQFSAETSPSRGVAKESAASSSSSAAAVRARSKSMSIKSTGASSRRVVAAQSDLETSMLTAPPQPIHSSSPYKVENGVAAVEIGENKKRSAIKNLSFTRSRATSFGAASAKKGAPTIPTMAAKDVLPQESAGEAMMMILHISDGEDGSSLTASTSSQSSSEEETTGEKERTAISVKGGGSSGSGSGVEELLGYASLHGSGGSRRILGGSGNLIIGNGDEQQQQQWSPTRILEIGEEVAMEEEEDDDDDEVDSESVV